MNGYWILDILEPEKLAPLKYISEAAEHLRILNACLYG